MTIDELEKQARYAAESEQRDLRDIAECRRMEAIGTLTGAARGATETAAQLGRALLAILPFVRAAKAARDGHVYTCACGVCDAYDDMRTALESGK